jgi:hypothetical protein
MSNISKLMMQSASGNAGGVAIEYMGSKTASYYGNTASTVSLSLSGALSGGSYGTIQEGDLVLVTFAGAVSSAYTISFNTSGYTELFNIYGDSWDNDSLLFGGYKIMGATPDTSVVINKSASYQQYHQTSINAHVYRYVDTTTPIDAAVGTASTTTSTLPPFSSAGVTTVTKNAYVIAIGANGYNNATVSDLSWSGVFNSDTFTKSVIDPTYPDMYYALAAYISETPEAITPSTISTSKSYTSGSAATAATIPLRPANP